MIITKRIISQITNNGYDYLYFSNVQQRQSFINFKIDNIRYSFEEQKGLAMWRGCLMEKSNSSSNCIHYLRAVLNKLNLL